MEEQTDMASQNRSMSVFVIVREYPDVKDKLWEEAKEHGYDRLSDYVRTFWEHLQ